MTNKSKHSKIAYIKKVIKEWGPTTAGKLQLESSPCINSLGDGNVCELVEDFDRDGVGSTIYDRYGVEIDWNNYDYEELSEDVINEIWDIIEQYEVFNLKFEKRCQS
jgi:hypothetical protein